MHTCTMAMYYMFITKVCKMMEANVTLDVHDCMKKNKKSFNNECKHLLILYCSYLKKTFSCNELDTDR